MSDASRARGHRDFSDTIQIPPDVPCPTGPLSIFGFRLVIDPDVPADTLRMVSKGDAAVPVPSTWNKPVHAGFPDPEVVERERLIRKAKADAVERFALVDATRQHEALRRAKNEAHAIGFNKGKDRGCTHGWWGGLAFGMMLGAGMCFIAMKIGFAFGGQA